jgi:hypothetical protein
LLKGFYNAAFDDEFETESIFNKLNSLEKNSNFSGNKKTNTNSSTINAVSLSEMAEKNYDKNTTWGKINIWAIKNPFIFWPIAITLLGMWFKILFNL